MHAIGRGMLWVGLISLGVGMISRVTYMPLYGITAKSFLGLAQACFLSTIATALLARP